MFHWLQLLDHLGSIKNPLDEWLLLETPSAGLGTSIGTAKRLTVSDSSSPTGGLYFISLIFPLGFSKEPAGPLKKLVEPFWRKFQIFDFSYRNGLDRFWGDSEIFSSSSSLGQNFFAKSRWTFFCCCCLHKSQFYFIFITPTKTSLSFDVITVDGLIHKRRLEWRRILFSVTSMNFRLTLQSNRKLIE